MELLERLTKARRAAVPVVAITTADQPTLIQSLRSSRNGKGRHLFNSDQPDFSDVPLILWDSVRGWSGLNEEGKDEVAAMLQRSGQDSVELATSDVVESLRQAIDLPAGAVLFCENFHLAFQANPKTSQAIHILRDEFKGNKRTLILLAPSLSLPTELTQDVIMLDEALPSREEIEGIITKLLADNELPVNPAEVRQASDALSGLSGFSAEQSAAMSITKSGIDIPLCWERKRGIIEQTRGLTVTLGGPTFDDIGGLRNAIQSGRETFGGANPPRCIAFVDELEKFLGGAGTAGIGDSSGTTQDALGVILREMEGNEWTGIIGVGPAGSGKTLFASALGATFGVPTIGVDLGGAKGGIVGQSEERIRQLIKTVKAVGGSGVYWVATCNNLQVIPAALLRRFTDGIMFFDLPSAEEREVIWKIQCAKYGVKDIDRPVDTDWTGAEIRNCVRRAADRRISLKRSAMYQVPTAQADPEGLKALRMRAAGRFVSASYDGAYRLPGTATVGGRKLTLIDREGE